MWEVTYTITPDRGYFELGETLMWEHDIYLQLIHSIEFVSDGSVVIVYTVEGDLELLTAGMDEAENRRFEYTVSRDLDHSVIKIRFHPDDLLRRLFDIQRSYGVSMQFPLEYVSYDPASIEITEIGSREEIQGRIQDTREVASIDVTQIQPYEPATDTLFEELTDRQQEVLLTASEKGYYRTPREATQEDIAADLSCSPSVVGQHLRRIEATLVSQAVPEHFRSQEPPRMTQD